MMSYDELKEFALLSNPNEIAGILMKQFNANGFGRFCLLEKDTHDYGNCFSGYETISYSGYLKKILPDHKYSLPLFRVMDVLLGLVEKQIKKIEPDKQIEININTKMTYKGRSGDRHIIKSYYIEVKVNKSLTSIEIPHGIIEIGAEAFMEREALIEVIIPNTVKIIGDSAFEKCKSLETIYIPDGVTHIGEAVFMGCSTLKHVTIPNSVTSIERNAFSYCKSLTSIIIPNSVEKIFGYGVSFAFFGCTSLTIYTPFESFAWKYAERNGIKHEIQKGI